MSGAGFVFSDPVGLDKTLLFSSLSTVRYFLIGLHGQQSWLVDCGITCEALGKDSAGLPCWQHTLVPWSVPSAACGMVYGHVVMPACLSGAGCATSMQSFISGAEVRLSLWCTLQAGGTYVTILYVSTKVLLCSTSCGKSCVGD